MNISQIRNSSLEELLDIDLTSLNMVELEVLSAIIKEKVTSLMDNNANLIRRMENELSASCELINSILTCAQESTSKEGKENQELMPKIIEVVMSWRKKFPGVFDWEDYPYYSSIAPKCIFDFLATRKL